VSTLKNLLPGQYQIGDVVFGKHTNVRVENFDIKPYDLNAQDHQVSRNDEMRFGIDQLKPTTVEITMHVINNHLLHPYENLIPDFWANMPTVSDLHREWRADEVRQVWGAMKPLYYCGKDGITRVMYGRPGKFTYAKDSDYTESVQCLAEFRCGDTLSYTAQEAMVTVNIGEDPSYLTRQTGNASAWLRMLLFGPMTNPSITIGEQEVKLAVDIEEGTAIEISSYPWRRRILDSNGVSLNSAMVGKTQYLDRLTIPFNKEVAIRWTSEEYNTWMPDLGDHRWLQDIDTLHFWDLPSADPFKIFDLPSNYTAIHGRVVIRVDVDWNPLDFLNGSFGFQVNKFLHAGVFSQNCAVIYNDTQFNTAYQYSEAKIVGPFIGRSGIVIMSNDTMTNFVVLDIVAGIGASGNYLRIRTGTAYNALSAVRAEYHKTSVWHDDDIVGIGYDPPTNTYKAYLNRVVVATWVDSGGIVPTGINNRSQGLIFDMDSNLITQGIGLRDILSYDRLEVPVPTGQVVLLWQDAWNSIT
jgi:hypothetical protein